MSKRTKKMGELIATSAGINIGTKVVGDIEASTGRDTGATRGMRMVGVAPTIMAGSMVMDEFSELKKKGKKVIY